MTVTLPSDVYSSDQIGILIWEISTISARLQDESVRVDVTKQAASIADIHLSALLLSVLKTTQMATVDHQTLDELKAELESIREHAPVAHMILPVLPNKSIKRLVTDWFRAEIHPHTLVSYTARADIGGGFMLRTGSTQRDFSFRSKILDRKHRITEIFDNV